MTLIYISCPVILLSAACIGYGVLAMTLLYGGFAALPIAFRLTVAYFFGQGLLAALFVFLALLGAFTYPIVLVATLSGATLCILSIWRYWREIPLACVEASRTWLRAPISWRVMTVLAAILFIYGFATMGRKTIEVDASAFYLAAAKLIAHTGKIENLPGYEYFSWVIMTGELLYASLMLLGSPGTGARFYEWINFLPVLVALYWVARVCNLSVRASFLTVVMGLTSSAAVALWGGGKTDTFAVGPALIGVWFALASWRSDHRWNCTAMAGLFCGFAIAAKVTYLIVLLPGVMLLLNWHDTVAAIGEARALSWRSLLQRAKRISLNSAWFFSFLALALAPFLIKNLIVFHSPLGAGASLASSKWYSNWTVLRLILSYPIALTYGRYWAQLGTLSPLILAFFPLFFLMPRNERKLSSPVAALTISTVVAVAIWMALMPSIFMPRYILATLLLLGIPAAAGAAFASRERSLLTGIVLSATAIVIVLTPNQVNTRSPNFYADRAIDYFRNGNEAAFFDQDPFVATTFEVNEKAHPNDRVLLLAYPRVWLRGDLLAATSSTEETERAKALLGQHSAKFWTYLQDKRFSFMIATTDQLQNIAAVTKVKPDGLGFCQIKSSYGVSAFQIGERCFACPTGNRTTLAGPFTKPWPDGNAYVANIAELEVTSDTSASPNRSRLALCEDGRRLWPAQSVHNEIRIEGGGRYSHWEKQLYFSTSDNSDPNANGRTYTVVQP